MSRHILHIFGGSVKIHFPVVITRSSEGGQWVEETAYKKVAENSNNFLGEVISIPSMKWNVAAEIRNESKKGLNL